jgi:POT family proton-dependent oligopeptide transporter
MTTASQGNTDTIGGHPRGLYYLASTELWERFSFYGMQALLTLYMVKQLLLPGFAENVWGLAWLRGVFEFAGPISDTDFAGLIAGFYSGFVYFTPIIGGWIADRLLGAKRTVLIGVLLMSAGHLAMTFDQLFLVALVLLILGSGALKGNISSQVGTLYPLEARSLRERGFSIFSTGINIGAVTGPLTTGAVAAVWGWHAGFAVAAVLMLVALVTYLAGQRHFPEAPPRRRSDPDAKPLTPAERRKVWALIAVVVLTIPAEITYPMVWGIGPVWIDKYVALGPIPPTWFGSADSLGSILVAAPLIALWAAQARKGREPGSVGKIAIGTALTGVGALILAAGSYFSNGPGTVHILWPIAGYFTMGLAWMYYWPTTLALVSRVAPPAVVATMVGGAFISPFLAHSLAGVIATRFDNMHPAAFWTMDASIGLAGALLLFALKGPLTRELEGEARAA